VAEAGIRAISAATAERPDPNGGHAHRGAVLVISKRRRENILHVTASSVPVQCRRRSPWGQPPRQYRIDVRVWLARRFWACGGFHQEAKCDTCVGVEPR